MPFLNFESRHFSDAEKAAISTALQDLQTALAGKIATLTPEEEDMIFLTSNLGLHNLKFEIKDGKNEILSIKNGLWNHKGSKY